MAERRGKRSAIVVALTLGVSVVVPLAVTTLGAVGAALFVAAKYTTADLNPGHAARARAVDTDGEAKTAVEQGAIPTVIPTTTS